MRILRRSIIGLLFLSASTTVFAQQQGEFAGELSTEKRNLQQECSSSSKTASPLGCLAALFTGKPLHIAVGSLAPQNGFGLGPALVFEREPAPNWRLHLNADAVVSTNLSWRAGIYLNAIHVNSGPIQVTHTTRRPPNGAQLKPLQIPLSPGLNVYAQMISLNKLLYFGEGNFTSKSQEALYGMNEGIVGANVLFPLKATGLGLFGEVNGRFVDIRGRHHDSSPSLEQTYTEATAPGLARQPGFIQFGEGLRFDRSFGSLVHLDYAATLQEFIASGASVYSFRRFSLDLSHTFRLYGKTTSIGSRDLAGPDESPTSLPRVDDKKSYTRNLEGSVSFDVLLTESIAPAGHVVPFYYQPTLGGSNINGTGLLLPSYSDYRWRAPNAMLFRLSTEHSIWGPIGIMALADAGRVAMSRGELGFNHLRHSYGLGLTIRAGGLPQAYFLFAWGGNEGTHTTVSLNSSVLGGTSRPSLF